MRFKTNICYELSTSSQDSAANLHTSSSWNLQLIEVKYLWIKPVTGIYWVLQCYLTFTVNYSCYYLSKKCSFIFVWYFHLLSLIAWLTLIISLGNSGDVKDEPLKTVTALKTKISLAACALKPLPAIIPSLLTLFLKIWFLDLWGEE